MTERDSATADTEYCGYFDCQGQLCADFQCLVFLRQKSRENRFELESLDWARNCWSGRSDSVSVRHIGCQERYPRALDRFSAMPKADALDSLHEKDYDARVFSSGKCPVSLCD